MKRQTLVALVLVTILLASLVGFAVAQGPDRRGGHKLPVAPETPADDEVAETADAEAADAWEPGLGVVEGPGLRAGDYSFVGGGRKNKADGAYSSVVGGYNSWAKSKYATIGGGQHNTAKGWRSTVAGGRDNETKAEYATVGGGRENKATQGYSTVGGGYNNTASSFEATVGGGRVNTASGHRTTVGGGLDNTASATYATVGGGYYNTASGYAATVGGGYHNTASNWSATVGGGNDNTASGWDATVGGGWSNTASGSSATVGGGVGNVASGLEATVGGGETNTASDWYATVGGGSWNMASYYAATVGGGEDNTASGMYATVPGGRLNTASGYCATVGGGWSNTASGLDATVGGGANNTASGDYSFTAGHKAVADDNVAFVWGDSTDKEIHSGGANQFIVRANGGVWFGAVTENYTPTIGALVFISTTTGGYLSTGGAWTDSSDRNAKENIVPVDGAEVLERLVEMPISTWNYIAQDDSVQHIGPMAQDFHAAFGLGEDDRHIAALDLGGANTAAIQALYELVQELQAENAALREEVSQLRALEARIAALEQVGK